MTKGLVALIKSKTAITDLIGTNPTRLYPLRLPQATQYPAVVYRVNNNQDRSTFDGASTYDFSFVDLFCYAKTYDEASELWETLRTELEDTVGVFGGVNITHVWYMDSGSEDYLDSLELETKQLELKIGYTR